MRSNHIKQGSLIIGALVLAIFLGANSASAATATINKPTNMLGLVGYWTFDGKDMTPNVRDLSGQGNHGNLSGQTPTTTVIGKIGQALSFDGVDDYVNSPRIAQLGSGNMTLSGWFYFNNLASLMWLLNQWNPSPSQGPALFIYNSRVTFEIGDGYIQGDTTLVTKKWYHIAAMNEGTTWRIYLNGILDKEQAGNTNTYDTSNSFNISEPATKGGVDPLSGFADDVRVYGRALSATEVLALYNSGSVKLTKTSSPGSLTSGLVGHWTFDGADMTPNVRDISGQGNHGNLGGQLSTTTVLGKIGQALRFDGSDDVVTVSPVGGGSLQPASVTVSAWVRYTSQRTYDFIAGSSDAGTKGYRLYYINGTGLIFEINTFNANYASVAFTADNQWHHVVGTYDGANTRIYLDGVQGTPGTISDPIDYSGVNTFWIGWGSGWDYWQGSLDDIRVYNRALSAAEVKQLSNMGLGTRIRITPAGSSLLTGLSAYWKLDETSGTRLDSTSAHLDLTDNNSVGNASGIISNAAVMSATYGRYLSHADDSAFKIAGDRTFNIWVYRASDAQIGFYFSVDDVGGNRLWDLYWNSLVTFLIFDPVDGFGLIQNGTIATGEWHMVTGTYNSSTRVMELFIDATSKGTFTLAAEPTTGSAPFLVGSLAALYNSDDRLDEVGVWSRVLTGTEITSLYNSGAGLTYPFN